MPDLLKTLLLPENRLIAWVMVGLSALTIGGLIYLVVRRRLKFTIPLLLSVEPGGPANDRAGSNGDDAIRRYRKVLYAKVTCLSDRSKGSAPFYHRTVKRLSEAERSVPVFDETVYYTLELLPKTGPIIPRKDRSSGVVDSRIVIPWLDEVGFRDGGAGQIKEFVQLETNQDSDTFLTVSHFENGLQGSEQDLATDVPEDAEYVRLMVDFSSVPGAARFITADRACIRHNGQEEIAPIAQPSPALFVVVCKDVRKSSLIKISFNFDWNRLA